MLHKMMLFDLVANLNLKGTFPVLFLFLLDLDAL